MARATLRGAHATQEEPAGKGKHRPPATKGKSNTLALKELARTLFVSYETITINSQAGAAR